MNLTLVGDDGRRLVIAVHGYERETALDPYDANWLRGFAEVEHGAFRGAVETAFTTSDFKCLLAEIDGIMSGSSTVASFDTMEEALAFRVEMKHAGRVCIRGNLRDVARGVELTFAFESDRTFLANAHSELQRLVDAFPERSVQA